MLIERQKPSVSTYYVACCDRCHAELGLAHPPREDRPDTTRRTFQTVNRPSGIPEGDVVLVTIEESRDHGLPRVSADGLVLLCRSCADLLREFLTLDRH